MEVSEQNVRDSISLYSISESFQRRPYNNKTVIDLDKFDQVDPNNCNNGTINQQNPTQDGPVSKIARIGIIETPIVHQMTVLAGTGRISFGHQDKPLYKSLGTVVAPPDNTRTKKYHNDTEDSRILLDSLTINNDKKTHTDLGSNRPQTEGNKRVSSSLNGKNIISKHTGPRSNKSTLTGAPSALHSNTKSIAEKGLPSATTTARSAAMARMASLGEEWPEEEELPGMKVSIPLSVSQVSGQVSKVVAKDVSNSTQRQRKLNSSKK